MRKFYLFGGCSFTDMHDSWARQIATDIIKDPNSSKNCAKSGAGNDFIGTSVLHHALEAEKQGFVPDVSIMWSSPSRYEVPISQKETPFVKDLFNTNNEQSNDFNPGTFFENSAGNIDRTTADNWWLMQCSKVTSKTEWTKISKIDKEYVKTFEYFQEYLWNLNYQWYSTLKSILLMQNICKTKKWNYRFMVHRDGFGEHIQFCSPQFKTIQNEIDWDNFIFTDNRDGGLREYTLATVNTWDDGYDNHPSKEAHSKFVYDFLLPNFPGEYN